MGMGWGRVAMHSDGGHPLIWQTELTHDLEILLLGISHLR